MDDFTYILNTKLPNGVVHQHDAVLHSNPNVPVHPAAFLGPVLETFILLVGGRRNKESQQGKTDGAFTQATDADSTRCSTRGRAAGASDVRENRRVTCTFSRCNSLAISGNSESVNRILTVTFQPIN